MKQVTTVSFTAGGWQQSFPIDVASFHLGDTIDVHRNEPREVLQEKLENKTLNTQLQFKYTFFMLSVFVKIRVHSIFDRIEKLLEFHPAQYFIYFVISLKIMFFRFQILFTGGTSDKLVGHVI